MARDITTLGRNFLLSLSGEGVQSGFHFALNLLLIRILSAYDFGVFAIVFVLGGISLTYGNALISVLCSALLPVSFQSPRPLSSPARCGSRAALAPRLLLAGPSLDRGRYAITSAR